MSQKISDSNPRQLLALRLPAQCNVHVRVNDLNLRKENMTQGRIRTPTWEDFHL